MQINKNIRLTINLSNRKYKMMALELVILCLIVILSQVIVFFWPLEEPLRQFDGDYWLYMLLAFAELLLIGAMFFILGIWYMQWRFDKTVRLSQVLEMENLSPKKANDRDHTN